jgi:hypothetical protein
MTCRIARTNSVGFSRIDVVNVPSAILWLGIVRLYVFAMWVTLMKRPSALANFSCGAGAGRSLLVLALAISAAQSAWALDPPPTAWNQVADFQSDFKPGGPAAGWTYAWNPTGKVGNSQAFTTLAWSNIAQAYNTTGAATMVPSNNKTHNDDYLMLYASGGHPGKPNYLPIIGYTIQPEDGAGHYRLFDSSIAKWDSTLSQNEDGLGVLMYLNNTQFPPAKIAGTNGQIVNFDRDLGQLNVGDKIWVMISALKNQNYDSFRNFDFSIQKLTTVAPIPEPGTALLLLIALAGCRVRRRRKVNL